MRPARERCSTGSVSFSIDSPIVSAGVSNSTPRANICSEVMVTAVASVERAVDAMRLGATDVLR